MSCLHINKRRRSGVMAKASRPAQALMLPMLILGVLMPWASIRAQSALDFGDAPSATYPTLLNQNGARHTNVTNIRLGLRIDTEADGQPNTLATGDDILPVGVPSDEDGVTFLTSLYPGQTASVQVQASVTGILNAWIDYNGLNGWTDAGERALVGVAVTAGPNTFQFTVPAAARIGSTFARFRFSTFNIATPSGTAPNGEVEDYSVNISAPQDYGDAPSVYPTLLVNNGARHTITAGFIMGTTIDPETNGQPSPGATDDDTRPTGAPDDEDGVRFLDAPLVPGSTSRVEVVVSAPGMIDAWLDFTQDGDWVDNFEQIFTSQPVVPGPNVLLFGVPPTSIPGQTYARIRFSRDGRLSFVGLAPEGEVEDYAVTVAQLLDYSDAPDPSFPTLLSSDGARHIRNPEVFLGAFIDLEPDGQPNSDATGDDFVPPGTTGLPDDEDGVVFTSPIRPGSSATVQITASIRGFVNAWIDFNKSGSWEPGEQIYDDLLHPGGALTFTFAVPPSAEPGKVFARFRFNQQGGLEPKGLATDGEVEDYQVTIDLPLLDFSDAPDPTYPTLLANNGARHMVQQGVYLGQLVDLEPDGQPNSNATGDDQGPGGLLPPPDDEDGVVFLTGWDPGEDAMIRVTASVTGFLNAWVDFNRNGSWADSGEQIFVNQVLAAGPNTLTVKVPANALLGTTFARFRFNLQGNLSFVGPAQDGEVEDYQVLVRDRPVPCEQSNKGRDFWLTFPANYAPDPDNPLKLTLSIVGPRDTAGFVEIPGLNYVTNFVIPPTMKAIIRLPKEADLGDANDLIQNLGIHVRANADVAVFGLSRVLFTTDGFMGIPSTALGRGYVIQTYANVHQGVPSLNGSQFALVACDDATTVGILPSADAAGRQQGVAYFITLNRGETYQLRGTNDAPTDLSGTLIVANKPIAAFGSHRCANIPTTNQWFCDYVVEQLLPAERAGQFFVSMPLATRTGGDTFRVFPVQNKTVVSVNGVPVATVDLGDFHQQIIAGPAYITADKPVLVMQYANSADYDPVPIQNADPFELVVPSVNMFLTQYMICVPDAGYVSYHINVVVPSAGVGSVLLNGVAIPAGLFVPIPGSGYHGAQVLVGPGVLNMTSGGGGSGAPLPFGVSVYGWAEFDSFGYPGGMFFSDKEPPMLVCPETNVVLVAQTECVAPVPDFRRDVEVFDNCPPSPNRVVTQDPPPGTLLPVGTHIVTLSASDSEGNIGICQITVTVVDPSPINMQCPQNIVVDCTSAQGAVVTYVVNAFTQCQMPVSVVCTPAPGSTFPPGDTTVVCTATGGMGQTASCTFRVTVRCLTIDFAPQPGSVVVEWTGGGTLQQSDTPTGNWSDLTGVTSPYTTVAQPQGKFFRVQY